VAVSVSQSRRRDGQRVAGTAPRVERAIKVVRLAPGGVPGEAQHLRRGWIFNQATARLIATGRRLGEVELQSKRRRALQRKLMIRSGYGLAITGVVDCNGTAMVRNGTQGSGRRAEKIVNTFSPVGALSLPLTVGGNGPVFHTNVEVNY
jgi:hypothetical protein